MKKDDPAFLKLTPLFHQPLPFFEKNRTGPPPPPPLFENFENSNPDFIKRGVPTMYTGLELSVSRSQNAIYLSIIVMTKETSFYYFCDKKLCAKHKKTHVNSIYIVGIMFVR